MEPVALASHISRYLDLLGGKEAREVARGHDLIDVVKHRARGTVDFDEQHAGGPVKVRSNINAWVRKPLFLSSRGGGIRP